jgi:hypothetical protein
MDLLTVETTSAITKNISSCWAEEKDSVYWEQTCHWNCASLTWQVGDVLLVHVISYDWQAVPNLYRPTRLRGYVKYFRIYVFLVRFLIIFQFRYTVMHSSLFYLATLLQKRDKK